MTHSIGQTRKTADAFNDWACHWSSHYSSNGVMANRINRFSEAMDALGIEQGKILDFGCGTGEITQAIASRGGQLTGCDLSPEMLSKARAADPDMRIDWIPIDAARSIPLPFPEGAFAGVYSSSVFEYLSEPQVVVRDINRILKPGGWLLFTVPDPRHPIRRKESVKIMFARNALFWAFIKQTRWQSEFLYLRLSVNRLTVEAWLKMLTDEGFLVPPVGLCQDPLALIAVQKPSLQR